MLDVTLQRVSFAWGDGFALRDLTITFPRSTHTALVGAPSCGASTLLRLIAGTLKPAAGEIIAGQRSVTHLKAGRRPFLFVTAEPDVPPRWSVQHALVAALRGRSLDLVDRRREYELAIVKWDLAALATRSLRTLSSTEVTRVHLARIELLRPGILLADRLLEGVSAAARTSLADELYRTLRVAGTTVVSALSSHAELAFTDAVVVLSNGALVQTGSAAEVFAAPVDEAAARGTGDVDAIPVTIRGTTVESVIGHWEVDPPPFQGSGVALVRPGDFAPAGAGEDSDFIFGIEEAGFTDGRWIARGLLSGGISLRVALPRETGVHKGRLIALRSRPERFLLLPRPLSEFRSGVPTDVVPPMRDTR